MADQKNNNDGYKMIVIIGTGLFLLWGFASLQQKILDNSKVLGYIVGPIFMYFIYKIMKTIWPDLW